MSSGHEMQLSQRGGVDHNVTWSCFRAIVGDSGARGLWYGTTPRLIRPSVSCPPQQGIER